jgi:hypothetical protein
MLNRLVYNVTVNVEVVVHEHVWINHGPSLAGVL